MHESTHYHQQADVHAKSLFFPDIRQLHQKELTQKASCEALNWAPGLHHKS